MHVLYSFIFVTNCFRGFLEFENHNKNVGAIVDGPVEDEAAAKTIRFAQLLTINYRNSSYPAFALVSERGTTFQISAVTR